MRRLSLLKFLCSLAIFCILVSAGTALADPVCVISQIDEGPPFKVTFSVQERTVGIKSITVVEAINASVSYQPFPPGYIYAISVVATKVDPGGSFSVTIRATDTRNRVTTCFYEQEEPVEEGPPTCDVSSINAGPPFEVEFTIDDDDDGLESISVVNSVNANVTIPPFFQGITDPVTVKATKQNEALALLVELEAVDMGGRSTVCRYEQESTDKEPPVFETVSQIPGPPVLLEIGVRDSGSGLKSIVALSANNATVFIPGFALGTKDAVVVEVSQTIGNMNFSVLVEARDMSDNSTTYEYPVQSFLEARPEFDAVGKDSINFFKDYYKNMVIPNARDKSGRLINDFSDFASERFTNTAAGLTSDRCFSSPGSTYLSSLAATWTEAAFEWLITLQMKPASDISLQIVGCVLSAGETDIWKHARQTGLYSTAWAPQAPVFAPQANPRVTVRAFPGPFAKIGFPEEGFYLDARRSPGLESSSLVASYQTIQSLLDGNIIMAFPKTGNTNAQGETMYELSRGDVVKITIEIPYNNTADVRFGSDNVFLKYLGLVGTEYTTAD